MQPLKIEVAASWDGRVDRSGGPDACWPWTGGLMTNGYGQTRIKESGRWRGAGAHQVAYYLATGLWERLSEGRVVRHLCHNRPCCNPAHLTGGTHQDNMDDKVAHRAGISLLPPVAASYVLRAAGVAYDWHPSMGPPSPNHTHPVGSPIWGFAPSERAELLRAGAEAYLARAAA